MQSGRYSCPNKASKLFVALLSVALLPQDLPAQERGAVRGTVIDADGKPVRDVTVMLRPTDTLRSLPRVVLTDVEGKFDAIDLAPRKHDVIAFKNEDGYGNPNYAIYRGERPPIPQVDVTPGRVVEVIVNLGQQGAILIGDVVDFESGRHITKSYFRLVRLDGQEGWLSSTPDENGHIVIPIPSTGVELEVTMPGYEPWRSGPILVPRGSTKTITIPLRPQR